MKLDEKNLVCTKCRKIKKREKFGYHGRKAKFICICLECLRPIMNKLTKRFFKLHPGYWKRYDRTEYHKKWYQEKKGIKYANKKS